MGTFYKLSQVCRLTGTGTLIDSPLTTLTVDQCQSFISRPPIELTIVGMFVNSDCLWAVISLLDIRISKKKKKKKTQIEANKRLNSVSFSSSMVRLILTTVCYLSYIDPCSCFDWEQQHRKPLQMKLFNVCQQLFVLVVLEGDENFLTV